MGENYENGYHKGYMEHGTPTSKEPLFLKGRTGTWLGETRGSIDAAEGFLGKAGAAFKGGTKVPALIAQKAGDAVTGTAKGGARFVSKVPGFKLGGYAAAGAAGIGLLAFLANNGKKVVTEADVELPPVDTTAMANFDAPAPQMLTSEPPTLMGLPPVEGEHVSRLGKSGQQSFRDIAPPRAAIDAGFEDVSAVPTR